MREPTRSPSQVRGLASGIALLIIGMILGACALGAAPAVRSGQRPPPGISAAGVKSAVPAAVLTLPLERVATQPMRKPFTARGLLDHVAASRMGTVLAIAGERFYAYGPKLVTVHRLKFFHCDQFVGLEDDSLWCIDRLFDRIGVSEDGGVTWLVGSLSPFQISVGFATSFDSNTLLIMDPETRQFWRAEFNRNRGNVVLRAHGTPALGGGCELHSVFAFAETICLPQCAYVICSRDSGATWHFDYRTELLRGVGIRERWWGLDKEKRLVASDRDHQSWTAVAGAEGCRVGELMASSRATLFFGGCNGEPVLAELDAGGRVFRRTSLAGYEVVEITASGGSPAVGTVCGAYSVEPSGLVLRIPLRQPREWGEEYPCPEPGAHPPASK